MPLYNPISNSDLIAPGAVNKYYTDAEKAAIQTQFNERTSYGVVSGLIVAQQTVADMTVKVSAGIIYMADGTRYAPSAVAIQAVTAADATNPRIDIVYVNSSGVISYLAGTAGATPTAPSVPAGGQNIAEITVAANQTTVVTANISDRRQTHFDKVRIYPTMTNTWISNANNPVYYYKDSDGYVCFSGRIESGTLGRSAFTMPAEYRPATDKNFSVAATLYSYVFVTANGAVISFGNNTWMYLDVIKYKPVIS